MLVTDRHLYQHLLTQCFYLAQRRSRPDRHLHWHRCHDGGPGGGGQSGHLRLRGQTPQTEMSNGSS